jgi:HK97 gp10 family phage protein
MAAATFIWKGPEVGRHIRARLAPGVRKAAELVADRARKRAPVLSGRLKASIEVRPTDNPLDFRVVADVPYASFVEFGSSGRPANPFLRRALAESADDVRAAYGGR